MRYIPATDTEVRDMLAAVGASDSSELFDDCVPADLQLGRVLNLPRALSEGQILAATTAMAEQNTPAARAASFLGAGFYHHFSPVFVNQILLRSEFLTAYTPYQPEIAQGTLQTIWEFQTLICQLTGMEVANASLYEGGSATAEAILMADRVARGKRPRALLADSLNPEYTRTCDSYMQFGAQQLEAVPLNEDGTIKAWHALLVKSESENPSAEEVEAARGFQASSLAAFNQDFDVWRAKAPIFQIMQIKSDGPFHKVREWYRQFYNPREESAERQAKVNGKYYTSWLEHAPEEVVERGRY